MSLKVLGAETGLHPSTAHRILASLIDNRLVEKDPGGRYRLGLRLLQLGVRLHSNIDLRSVALPVMERLRVPATARASFSFYNTQEEIDVFVRALGKVLEVFHE